ncbi:MAG TPA: response regulator [Acetobacteraceae bacterium]|nr:response regulator [Acetobacteraceae bacterium]
MDVIIADNDTVIRSILRSVLEGEGFNVIQGTDGAEAIDYATQTQASLVILDYRMPRLDGIAACSEIRQLPGYAETPIIFLTGFDDADTRRAAQAAGASIFLAKPFTPADLLRTVGDLLGVALVTCTTQSAPRVWRRPAEPKRLFGEPSEFARSLRLLGIRRRR